MVAPSIKRVFFRQSQTIVWGFRSNHTVMAAMQHMACMTSKVLAAAFGVCYMNLYSSAGLDAD